MYTGTDNGFPKRWDVLVIGAGNAGLCAAITAAEAGCSVIVLDAAPRDMRGGNTRHTRNLRAMHEAPTDVLTDAYSFEEYFEDLTRVTRGITNRELASLTLEKSAEIQVRDFASCVLLVVLRVLFAGVLRDLRNSRIPVTHFARYVVHRWAYLS